MFGFVTRSFDRIVNRAPCINICHPVGSQAKQTFIFHGLLIGGQDARLPSYPTGK